MTTTPLRGALNSSRTPAAWALVGYAALHLVFAFAIWILPDDNSKLVDRSANASFTSLIEMAMPVVAVLVAVHMGPVLRQARLIASVALLEYAASLVFGLMALLIGVGSVADRPVRTANDMFSTLSYGVLGTGRLALVAVAGWVTYRAFSQVGGRLPAAMTRS